MIYAGIVVGGLLDGRRASHTSQTFKVPVLATTDEIPELGKHVKPPTGPVPIETHVYEYGPIYLDANTELNLWKPHGQSRLETLRLLIAGYKP